jgi:hypothetical protein
VSPAGIQILHNHTRTRAPRWPVCVGAKQIDKGDMLPTAEVGDTVVMWRWIGDDQVTAFSY